MQKTFIIRKLFGVFAAYLTLILLIALPDGLQTRLSTALEEPICHSRVTTSTFYPIDCGISIFTYSTAADYLTKYDKMDMASYVRGALQIVDNNLLFSPKLAGWKLRQNGYAMWAPGIFFLNAIPLSIERSFPLGLYHTVLASIFWAIALTILVHLLSCRMRILHAAILPLTVFSLPLFSDYFFRHGVVLIESVSTALLITSVTLLIRCTLVRSSVIIWLGAGLFMFAASFIRSQIFLITIAVSICLLFLSFLGKFKRHSELSNVSITGVVIFVSIIWIPIGLWMFWNEGKLFDVSYAYKMAFLLDPHANREFNDFIISGGFAAACAADVDNCERVRALINSAAPISDRQILQEILSAFFHSPVSFLSYKLPIAWLYWNQPSQYVAAGYLEPEYLFSTFFLACGLLGLLLLVKNRRWVILLVCVVCIFFSVIPMIVFHFEVRYFFLTKALLIFILIWSLAAVKNPRQRNPFSDQTNTQKKALKRATH